MHDSAQGLYFTRNRSRGLDPKLNILIISTFFPPVNSIASDRAYSWAKYWSQMGHQITVLTTEKSPEPLTDLSLSAETFELIEVPLPKFLQRMKRTYGQAKRADPERLQKLPWHFSALDHLRSQYGIFHSLRMPDLTDLWIRSALKHIYHKGPWDLVISTSGPYAVHIIAHRIKARGLTTTWIADFRDLWVENRGSPGLFPFTWIESWLERRLLRDADAITTVSHPLANRMQTKYPAIPVHVIENGFDPSLFDQVPSLPAFPNDGKIRIVYMGNIFEGRQDPGPLFKAIAELHQNPEMRKQLSQLEVLFTGQRVDRLQPLIDRDQIGGYVRLTPPVNRERSLQMQRDAFALLFLPWKDPSEQGILTGKLFEYLYSNTPIWSIGAAHLEDSQRLILQANAGYILGCDVQRIKRQLIEALTTKRKAHFQRDEGILLQYRRDVLAQKLLNLFPLRATLTS